MGQVNGRALDAALSRADIAVLPIAGEGTAVALTTAQSFGPFDPGDTIIIGLTGSAHIVAGTSGVTATTSNPVVTGGVFKFVMPDSCTHVSMIQASGSTSVGSAYKG